MVSPMIPIRGWVMAAKRVMKARVGLATAARRPSGGDILPAIGGERRLHPEARRSATIRTGPGGGYARARRPDPPDHGYTDDPGREAARSQTGGCHHVIDRSGAPALPGSRAG